MSSELGYIKPKSYVGTHSLRIPAGYVYLGSKITPMEFEWKGVMPALTTKFDETDSLDFDLFDKNVRAQLDAGVSGIILG